MRHLSFHSRAWQSSIFNSEVTSFANLRPTEQKWTHVGKKTGERLLHPTFLFTPVNLCAVIHAKPCKSATTMRLPLLRCYMPSRDDPAAWADPLPTTISAYIPPPISLLLFYLPCIGAGIFFI